MSPQLFKLSLMLLTLVTIIKCSNSVTASDEGTKGSDKAQNTISSGKSSTTKTSGPFFDTSIQDFNNERTCWTGEVCKTEFQAEFKCKCPKWYWCRGPGRYYHAYCSMSALGHIWLQPNGLREEDAMLDRDIN